MSERRAAQLIVLCTAVASLACGHPEQRIVDQYFNALKTNDNQTLTSFAMVAFDKKVDDWKITGSVPETRSPAALPDLARKVAELEAELAANKKAAGTYANEHYSEIDKVKEIQKAGKPVPAGLAKVAEKEKRNVILSVGQVDDVEKLTGEMVQKQVDLDLTVAGEPKAYTMMLRKYELSGGSGSRMVSRWVVQDIKPKG